MKFNYGLVTAFKNEDCVNYVFFCFYISHIQTTLYCLSFPYNFIEGALVVINLII